MSVSTDDRRDEDSNAGSAGDKSNALYADGKVSMTSRDYAAYM